MRVKTTAAWTVALTASGAEASQRTARQEAMYAVMSAAWRTASEIEPQRCEDGKRGRRRYYRKAEDQLVLSHRNS